MIIQFNADFGINVYVSVPRSNEEICSSISSLHAHNCLYPPNPVALVLGKGSDYDGDQMVYVLLRGTVGWVYLMPSDTVLF